MKIICSQGSLLHGIQTVQKGISSRIGLPIYNGILFEANEDNKVHLFATDLEIGIDCYIPAQVIETGSTVIPSKIISELIKKFPEGKIEIECSENNITTVKENNSNYKILGFSAEEFSNFPEIKMRAKIKLNQKLFKETIQQVIFSTSRDESKTFLNGALFKIVNNNLWYIITWIDNDNVINYKVGKNVIFNLKDEKVEGEIHKIIKNEKETLVIFKLEQNADNFYKLRNINLDAVVVNYEGLKIYKDSIVERNDKQVGVYVLDINRHAIFKPIKIIGYDDKYAIIKSTVYYEKEENEVKTVRTVKLYDEIVRRASKVESGEIIY